MNRRINVAIAAIALLVWLLAAAHVSRHGLMAFDSPLSPLVTNAAFVSPLSPLAAQTEVDSRMRTHESAPETYRVIVMPVFGGEQ